MIVEGPEDKKEMVLPQSKNLTFILKMQHPLTPNGSSEYYITSVGSGLFLAVEPGVLPPHAIVLLIPLCCLVYCHGGRWPA